MNKKLQKGLVAAVAATLSTGIVAPVYAASVETKSFDAQYAEAYNATVNAKTQKELTAARVLVDKLYADLPQDLKNLAATLSAILDPKQQTELVKLDNAIKAAEVSGKQADVNVATALIVDMPIVWKTSFSSYMDKIQQAVINKAVAAATKAKTSGLKADYDAALALYNELLTVTNNDGVKAWVEVALKAELDAAAKLEVVSVKAINSTQAVVTFSTEVAAVSEDNFTSDNDVTVIKAEVGSNKKQVTLTFNEALEDGVDYEIAIQDVKNLLGNAIATDAKATLEYVVTDVTKIELTKTAFKGGDNVLDSVKITDEDGRDITDEFFESYGYDLVISSTSGLVASGTKADADDETTGLVSDITDSSYAYVEVKVMDGDDVVATTEAIKITLSPAKIESFVGFHIGDVLADADAYNDLVDDEDVSTSIQKQYADSDTDTAKYLNVVVKNDGDDYLLTSADIDKVENLTPAIAYVNDDETGLRIRTIATGTAKVRITSGSLVTTVTFEVKANSSIKSADIDTTSVTLNSATDAVYAITKTATLSLLDQYGDDFDIEDLVPAATSDAKGEKADVYVGTSKKGTLTVTSSKPSVATVEIGAVDGNEIALGITEVAKGTATITVTFKNTDDVTIFTKTISVVSKEFGDFDHYTVTADDTALNFEDADTDDIELDDDDVADIAVYEVDAAGNKLRKLAASEIELSFQDTDDYDDVSDYVGINAATAQVGLIGLNVDGDAVDADASRLAIKTAGTLKVDVKVGDVKVTTVSISYKNTTAVAAKASVNTANVVVDLSNNYGTGTTSIDINDIIYGLYNDDDSVYDIKPILTILDQNGKTIEYDTDAAAGVLENGDAVSNVNATVTNTSDVTVSGSTVTLKTDKISGSFTIVLADVDTNENDDILSAPVAVRVTIVK